MPKQTKRAKTTIVLLLSFVVLFCTLPLLDSTPYFGIPLWVYLSFGMTLLYVVLLVFLLEKRWDALSDG